MNFESAFKAFLDSVKNHDFRRFKSFLDSSRPIDSLLPGRRPIRDYADFIASQAPYFDDPNQVFDYRIRKTFESDGLGFGVCDAEVKTRAGSETSLKVQICFLFQRANDEWILRFNQNTELKPH